MAWADALNLARDGPDKGANPPDKPAIRPRSPYSSLSAPWPAYADGVTPNPCRNARAK